MSRQLVDVVSQIELLESKDLLKRKIRKLNYVISQIIVVNSHLEEEEIRYQRKRGERNRLGHSYNIRIRLCVYHGIRDMYREYADRLRQQIRHIIENWHLRSDAIDVINVVVWSSIQFGYKIYTYMLLIYMYMLLTYLLWSNKLQ